MVREFLFLLFVTAAIGQEPLPKAHAHNDYKHERPLLDALAHGFCGVEADIYLVDGKLLIAHDPTEIRPERSLQSLYLDPLRERAKTNKGHIYPKAVPFTLLIDIKSDGETTYRALSKILAGFSDLVSDQNTERAVTVVISGNRAKNLIAADDPRHAGIDGRLSDLNSNLDKRLLPLISDRWARHFNWSGEGDMPAPEREKLHAIVETAHSAGRRVRFWATPEKESVWRELNAAGVDLINTDDLAGLSAFLRALPSTRPTLAPSKP
ncbi:MAG: phosphatidylinositol-specific phospholipase C/glycerophosphodiester phosphodiesterase family protein [Akkermansiaceae bacterium]|nr:phosphatidylinositol-specific phospholipase C/glycerophosphodiester phosphodiesterase family protein [Akkermansiaceae bacterium]